MRRQRVLVLATTYPRWANDHEPGFVHELCRRLAERFEVTAVVPDAPGADASGDFDGVSVVRYRYAPRRFQTLVNDGGIASNLRRSSWKWLLVPSFVVMQYLAARRVMKQHRVDVVHAHWLISPGVVARFACQGRTPYVVTSHGGDLFGFRPAPFRSVKRWVAARASAMSVVSSAMLDEVRRLALPVEPVDVIPMGVDLDGRFASSDRVRGTEELLFVGRLVPKKGLRHLIDAMPEIIAGRPNAFLTIAGFGPERESLELRCKNLGMEGHVRFVGALPQTELPALYQRAAVFVAPFVQDESGDQEGLPVALMEAIATGCPFVVGDVAGLDDLLGPAAKCFRVDPTKQGALAASILNCLADPALALHAAGEALVRVRAAVEWGAVAKRYGDLLAASIGGHSR